MTYQHLSPEKQSALIRARFEALREYFGLAADIDGGHTKSADYILEELLDGGPTVEVFVSGSWFDRPMFLSPWGTKDQTFSWPNPLHHPILHEIWTRTEKQIIGELPAFQLNRSIIQLANSNSAIDAIRQGLIHCGFELEFQALNGRSGDGETEIDTDALSEASSDAWYDMSYSDQISEIRAQDSDIGKLLSALYELTGDADWEPYVLGNKLIQKIRRASEDAQDSWREDWEDNNADSYRTDGDVYEGLKALKRTKQRIDCGEDQSVKGGEIRTLGALTPLQFLDTAGDLLRKNKFAVDTGCSFHIHLSVPGVKHSYGQTLQAEMTAYLLENKARLPKGVRERLVSEKLDHFARLQLSTDKFTAVHFHSQGTWEFRLFGNVNKESDARRCLILAIEALRWSYRVKTGIEKSLVDTALLDSFHEASLKVREDKSTFRKVAKELRTERHSAA